MILKSNYRHLINMLIVGLLFLSFFGGCEESVKLANSKPAIKSLEKNICYTEKGGTVQFTVEATDADGDKLRYSWSATGGSFTNFSNEGAIASWVAPQQPGEYTITVNVTDEIDAVSASIDIDVCGIFPSTIEGDTAISNNGYKYLLKKTSRVVIPEGVQLTLNEGVVVVVSSEFSGLEVRGKLQVEGSEGKEVAFIPNTCEGGKGLWGGISFVGSAAEGDLHHLFVSSSTEGIGISDSASVSMYNCTSYNNSNFGITIEEGSSAVVEGCKIWDNGYGVYIKYAAATCYESSIMYSEHSGFDIVGSVQNPAISIERCAIANNAENGLLLREAANPAIHNCSIFNNGVDAGGYGIALSAYTGVDTIRAEYNFWGIDNDTEEEIEGLIYDANDNPGLLAYVSFKPWLTSAPVATIDIRNSLLKKSAGLTKRCNW